MQKLNKDQIQTTLTNLFAALDLENLTKLNDETHPSFSDDNIKKHKLPHINKFAKNYLLYRLEKKVDKSPMFFFVIEADKFDILHFRACVGWWYMIKHEIGNSHHPQIYVCSNFMFTPLMKAHIPINIFPCLYRVISLCEVYPRIGSKTNLFGLSFDMKIVDEIIHDRELPLILDSDVDVKILNALPGDVIRCRRIFLEEFPYGEYYFRKVKSTSTNIAAMLPSGLCFGTIENFPTLAHDEGPSFGEVVIK